jgi:hypothetical protein
LSVNETLVRADKVLTPPVKWSEYDMISNNWNVCNMA